jgi:Na+-transporting NADH:ubiquinone oxidoreductase subunit NqrA
MARYYREEGFEGVAQVANTLLSGVVLSGQGAGTTIYLLGANAHANTVLKQNNNNGSIIAYIAAGNSDFPATIAVTGNNHIFSSANDACSLFYYVD